MSRLTRCHIGACLFAERVKAAPLIRDGMTVLEAIATEQPHKDAWNAYALHVMACRQCDADKPTQALARAYIEGWITK